MSFSFFSFCFSFPPLLLSCDFKYFLSSPFLSFPLLSFPFLFSCLLPFHVSSFLVSFPSLLSYFLFLLHLCIISFLSSPFLYPHFGTFPNLISSLPFFLLNFFNSYLFLAFFPFLSLLSFLLPPQLCVTCIQ